MEYKETQRNSERADSIPGSVVLVKSTELDHIPVISKTYLNLSIKRKNKQVDKWIKEYIEKIKDKCSNHDWKNSPVFEGYIELHDRHTAKKGIPSSSAALIDFILEKGSVPKINTFVDIYNVISSYTGISIGAHDINKLEGTPKLEIIPVDMPFKMIGGSRDEIARKGEYGYVDEKGVLCRMDIKQCERTKVTENTTRVLMIFQGHSYLGYNDLKNGLHMLDKAILK
jgi:DNA/RNA-binding domain of Phe-tRNA-synthetase-like protein